MKNILTISFACLTLFGYSQSNIQDARSNYSVGQTVTIKGISANGPNQLGTIRYIQDATGGLPAFGSNLNGIQLGDSVSVTGVLYDYNGLLEISPTTSFINYGPEGAPSSLNVSIASTGESLEGRLIKITNVTFTTSGNFAGNTNYNVTDGTNTLQVRISTGSNLVGTAIPTGAVSVTGLMGQFNASYQLLPRFTNDIVTYVPPAREINVKIEGNDVLTGASYFIGNSSSSTLIIENSGSGTLTVSGAALSGTNSSEFSTNIGSNLTIAGGTQQNFNLNFTPTGNGTRIATLTISNDDNDESTYVINLEAVGLDNLASEPSGNPANFAISNIKAYTMNGTFNPVSSASQYLVLWNNGSPVLANPIDGQTYERGDVLGNAKVAYVGSSTSFVPRGIIANQNYHFAVYAFNGQGGFENYKTTQPSVNSANSLGNNIGSFYQSLNRNNPSFVSDLSDLINPHNFISYFNYKTTMMSQFEVKDTTDGLSFVICAYSGERKVFQDPFDWTPTNFSREHTYAHSWMPTYPADEPARPEYSDMHNLYPVNNTQANSPRSNLPLDDITGNVVFTYLEGRVGYGNGGQLVYEPRSQQKGNAARSIMYMAVSYNGIDGDNWGIPSNQSEQTLLNWHYADAPDNYEIARNEYIADLQGNRNPFVDSAEYACNVNFYNMSYKSCNAASLDELLDKNLVIFPVPSVTTTFIQVNGTEMKKITLFDMSGRMVQTIELNSVQVYSIDNMSLNTGQYFIEVETPYGLSKGIFTVTK